MSSTATIAVWYILGFCTTLAIVSIAEGIVRNGVVRR